jgi:tetratricopeptide (TPR) repeat protein
MSHSAVPSLPPLNGSSRGGSTALVEMAPSSSRRAAGQQRQLVPSGILTSATQTKYKGLASTADSDGSGSARILTARDLRSISKKVDALRTLQPRHRAGRITDAIPDSPFVKVEGSQDASLGLRLAPVNVKETALDVPLRLAAPAAYHAPAVSDAPLHSAAPSSSLSMRLVRMLKGSSQVPQHWAGERDGVERDVTHTAVIRDFETKVGVAKRAGRHHKQATGLFALAALHYNAANRDKAVRYFRDAAAVFEQLGDAQGLALCHNLIGVCLMHTGAHKAALAHHRAMELLAGPYGRAVAQLNLGVCYAAVGEHEFAAQAFADALRNAGDAGDTVLETIALGNSAIALMRLGDLQRAQHDMEQCLERCSVAGDKVGASVSLLLLGDMHSQSGDQEHAQFYFEHAVRVATEAGCTDVADIAKVSVGVARGAQSARTTVLAAAKSMGHQMSLTELVSTLP